MYMYMYVVCVCVCDNGSSHPQNGHIDVVRCLLRNGANIEEEVGVASCSFVGVT